MVFRKTGRTYNGMGVEVVDSFNYLGTLLSYNRKFSSFYEYLVGKSLKALNMLLFNGKMLPLQLRILLSTV